MFREPFTLEMNKEDRIIRGDVFVKDENGRLPVLVISHGFKGFKDWGFFPYAAERLADAGFYVVTFNFSMNGVGEDLENFTELDRFARNTYSREQEDLRFLIGQLREGRLPRSQQADRKRIGLIGHSRGGGNSLLYALEDPGIQAVALWNSIADVDLFSPQLKEEMRRTGRAFIPNARTGQNMPVDVEVLEDMEANRERFDIPGRLPELDRPLLIVQGDEDQAVPVKAARLLKEKAPRAELHILEGANHTFGAVHPFQGTTPHLQEALEKTARFFHQHFQ